MRLRRGKAADARGAGPFTGEALAAAKQAGATGTMVVRADSQFYNADVVAACRRADARFSVTVRMNPHVAAAISAIGEDTWTAIRYPDAFVDPDTGELVSDAEVAEVEYTAFTGRKKAEHVTARLIVRRARRLNAEIAAGQGELFTAWRYHPVFTDSPFEMLPAELHHRQHPTIEQVIADGKSSALAHLPSGDFQANAAWLTLWAIAHNLLRATGALAGASMRRPRPCAPTWSTSRPESPAPHGSCYFICPSDGPGNTRSPTCSPPPTRHRLADQADHPPARARPEHTWKNWADQPTPHTLRQASHPKPPKRSLRNQTGGFGLRHRPRQLFADRAYDYDKYRRLLWKRGIKPMIARRGVAHGSGLGKVRWVVERTFAWPTSSSASAPATSDAPTSTRDYSTSPAASSASGAFESQSETISEAAMVGPSAEVT